MGLKIGQVAERGRVNLQTVRYYEREGLLPEPPRLASGYRIFSDDAVRRVRFIKRAQELGFSLAEIRELLSMEFDHTKDCSDVQRLAKAKLADIDEKIRTLEAMKRTLSELADACPGRGPSTTCPILECIDSEGAESDGENRA
jgi:MerR family mercuric resistance operon transcriptional regulator